MRVVAAVALERPEAPDRSLGIRVPESRPLAMAMVGRTAELKAEISRVLTLAGEGGDYHTALVGLDPRRQDAEGRWVELEDHGYLLVFLHELSAFESVPIVVSVWRTDGDRLAFETLLDPAFSVEIGLAFLAGAQVLTDSTVLLYGSTRGGDEETTWGSIWAARWIKPRLLELLGEERYRSTPSHRVEVGAPTLTSRGIVARQRTWANGGLAAEVQTSDLQIELPSEIRKMLLHPKEDER